MRLSRKIILFLFCFGLFSFILFSQDNDESWKILNQKTIKYYNLGYYDLALEYAQKALIQAEEKIGTNTVEYAHSLNIIALLYKSMGMYVKAESLYVQVLGIYKILPPEGKHPGYATCLNNLAELYKAMGRYDNAESLYMQALEISKTLPPKGKHPDYAMCMSNLAALYELMGRYEEAEFLNKRAIEIRITLPPKGKHPDYAESLNNQALLYFLLGRYEDAEVLYRQAVDIYKNLPPEGKHPFYATSLNNLAELYESMERFIEADSLYEQTIEIYKNLPPKGKHPFYAMSLSNLGGLNVQIGFYEDAELLVKQALEIYKNLPPKEKHPLYAKCLNNLSNIYSLMKRYKEAEPLIKQAIEIFKILPPKEKHLDYAQCLYSLSIDYYLMGKYKKAEPYFINSLTIYIEFIYSTFTALNEIEKAQFYNTIRYCFETFYSFFEKSITLNSKRLLTKAYDVQLFSKALLFDSTKKMITRIRNSKDLELIKILNSWLSLRDLLSKEYKEDTAKKANELEKILAKKSQDFAQEKEKLGYTWEDVRNNLNKNEAAIEIVRYQVFDKEWTDTIHYAALILKKSNKYPEIVFLTNGNEMENELLALYNKTMKKKSKETLKTEVEYTLYTQYWEKVEDRLAGINRIYVSPDGVYNLININTLKDNDNNYYNKDIVRLTSTRDIIETESEQKKMNPCLIIGYPKYNIEREKQAETAKNITDKEIDKTTVYTPVLYTDKHKQISKKEYPSGVLFTIEEVNILLNEIKAKYQEYVGNDALEEVIKAADSPGFLHIGTHGFFYGEKKIQSETGLIGIAKDRYYKNPLHLSGLYFTGTNESIRQTPYYKGMDDGILTAYEVMNLNLDNTELVVLQACVTGLGNVKNGEGMYGLQRAFLTAGAKAVLMSLWEIPDNETSDFMLEFYRLWLARKEKRVAFKEAVEYMKEKYRLPYYWGGFVLVGE